MPTSDSDQVYDVFISYSHADKEWVWDWLVPRLKEAGLILCTDRESFDVGVPALVNMENAVAASRHTLLVLTPDWMQSQWTRFEALLTQHEDPDGLRQRTVPVLRQPCAPPRHIAMFTYADLTGEADDEAEFAKLLDALRGVRRLPDADRLLIGQGRPTDAKPLFPFPHNPNFVGREPDLTELHQLLQDEGVVGIIGLGGIGKTQLAAEYAIAHDDDYPDGIFWLNATADYLSELARLGGELRLPGTDPSAGNADLQMAQAVGRYLNNHPKALLVIDNIEDPADLNQEWAQGVAPVALRCRVLFTTRRHAPPGFVTHPLTVLSPDAARQLLCGRPEGRDIETANKICDRLGRLPLAIKLAGAYLRENKKITLAGYLERLTAEGSLTTVDATGLTEADLETRHIAAVEATLREQWKLVKAPDAQRLFRVAGLLKETQAIPLARLSLLTGLSQEAKPGYASPLDKALAVLVKMSLVEELTNEQIQLHLLVREFAERLTPDADRQSFTGRACRNLIEAYKGPAVSEHHILHRPQGIDDVMADVREALAFFPQKTASTSFLQEFYRLLDLEAHNLRSVQAKETPGFILQQLQNRAASERVGYDASAIADELRSRPDPYLIHRHPIAGEPPTLIRTLRGHTDAVYACAVTPDGKKVVSASVDGTMEH